MEKREKGVKSGEKCCEHETIGDPIDEENGRTLAEWHR